MLETQTLHEAGTYQEQLISSIDGASDRVLLETMVLDHLDGMEPVMDAVLRARQRGAAALVIYDHIFSQGSLRSKYGPGALRDFQSRMQELEDNGVEVHRVGKRELNPFAGRHHAKAVVVDNHAYVGGGINLTGESFRTSDFMLRIDDPDVAQALYMSLPELAVNRPADAIIFQDSMSEIIVDGGNKQHSRIYDLTCERADEAVKVHYVSKLAPDGRLLSILRHKPSEYWFNTIKSASNFDKLAILIDQSKARLKNHYRGDEILHAKFCVFEMPDGSMEAISGSHNFNSRGVAFGTQEIAIHTTDQAVCRELIDFAHRLSSDDLQASESTVTV